jgi:hypothetical protein
MSKRASRNPSIDDDNQEVTRRLTEIQTLANLIRVGIEVCNPVCAKWLLTDSCQSSPDSEFNSLKEFSQNISHSVEFASQFQRGSGLDGSARAESLRPQHLILELKVLVEWVYSLAFESIHSAQVSIQCCSIFYQIKLEFVDEDDQDTGIHSRYDLTKKILYYREKLDTWRRDFSVSHLLVWPSPLFTCGTARSRHWFNAKEDGVINGGWSTSHIKTSNKPEVLDCHWQVETLKVATRRIFGFFQLINDE